MYVETITTETEEIQEIIRFYYKSLYSTKLEKSRGNENFFRQIPGTKIKSESDKPSKQSQDI